MADFITWMGVPIYASRYLVLGVALLFAQSAFAQAPRESWLLLSSAVASDEGGPATARRATQQLARVLEARNGPRLLSGDRARTTFEQRGSTAPLMVSHSDLDALARDAQMALYHVASGLTGRARDDVERALARADKVLESLNREALAAQQLLDACLYLVRAELTEHRRQEARDQALQCRRLVPDIEPDGTMHPPDVIGILAEAEAELRQREPGSLRVESVPSGCAVFINGRHLGEAPLELPQLSPGEYRVQAECDEGRVGRVHRVTIGSARVVKRIDTRFDAAVQSASDISLRYDSGEAQRKRAYADAVEIGRVVGVSDVLLALPMIDAAGKPTDKVQVDRIQVEDGKLLAVVRLRVDSAGAIDRAALGAAARDLLAHGEGDYTAKAPAQVTAPHEVAQQPPEGGEPTSTAVEETESEATAGEERDENAWSPPAIGMVLGITGGVATLASWGMFAHQLSLESAYRDKIDANDNYERALTDLDDFELAPLIMGSAGTAALTASLPWLLPPAEGVPTLGYVAGGFGGALAIAGAVLLVRGYECDKFDIADRCTDILATTRLGGLLLVGALPWLSVPIVYWMRDAGAEDVARLTLEPTPAGSGGQVMLRGDL